jgi:type I restriction enzyme M protein
LRPTIPPPEILATYADEINRLLRESGIKDEFRPAVIGAIMLALWNSNGHIRKDVDYILLDINNECERAFNRANKGELADSIKVDEANNKLAIKARRIDSARFFL